eukprot:CAMPEP_0202915288 /NCGR_PEP_ID=MMETSP1392-20130828/65252_1 /ASSEMBLY_ACC=CAM_ASM_000868 /TAXON_ID=225041 /ORGANISM="Chlamydomonas chlamydogama, Strain SAG 11-48b" /LENGTH=85 /DNA_ID=CAMNT_0049607233 /DNA_START=293 /DNA_END=550 /DNA_ORIENTATION=+
MIGELLEELEGALEAGSGYKDDATTTELLAAVLGATQDDGWTADGAKEARAFALTTHGDSTSEQRSCDCTRLLGAVLCSIPLNTT